VNEKQEISKGSSPVSALYSPPTQNRFVIYSVPLLWGAIIALLVLNFITFFGLNQARLAAVKVLDEIDSTLEDFTTATIVYDLKVDETVPVQADVPLNYNANLPVDLVIPIDQSFQVPVQIPAGGQIILDVPFKANFPLNETIPIRINESTRVDTVVHLDFTVPIKIEIAQTPLVGYIRQTQANVAELKQRLAFQ
jgi:hypothetical protein